jgi:hypothetical protein
MKAKLFVKGSGWGKPITQFQHLEAEINSWLDENPNINVEHAHRLSQPTFGWGQLAVAVWYTEPNANKTVD